MSQSGDWSIRVGMCIDLAGSLWGLAAPKTSGEGLLCKGNDGKRER